LTEEIAAATPVPAPPREVLPRLADSLRSTLGSLPPEDRFLLSAWFLDQRTLLAISRSASIEVMLARLGRRQAR